jgi:hypothetical protein
MLWENGQREGVNKKGGEEGVESRGANILVYLTRLVV